MDEKLVNLLNKGIKPTMMIDMDDVIVTGNFFDRICTFLNKSIDISDIKVYYLQTLLGDREDEFWRWITHNHLDNFYEDSPLMDGVYETLDKYNDYILYTVVTSYLWPKSSIVTANNLKYKYEYIMKMLPMIDPARITFTNDKSIESYNIRLDDKLGNIQEGELRMLYSAWHNQDITDDELKSQKVIRVDNWQEVDKVLGYKLGIK